MREQQVCTDCGKKRERCRAVNVDPKGNIQWICRACWALGDYDSFLYQHRSTGKDKGDA